MDYKFFLFLSEILGQPVRDSHSRRVGYLCDIAMKINGEIYPKAAHVILKRGWMFNRQYAIVEWDAVKEVTDFVKLKIDGPQITYQKNRPKFEFGLCTDILDQQIVDIDNKKVVRVNDIHLLRGDHHLYLAHVDVGSRGLIRRLGWTKFIDRIVHRFSPHSAYLNQEAFISWKNAQVLSLGRVKNVVRLDVARQKLTEMHPTELAEIISDLDKFEKSHLFRSLDVVLQRKVFTDLSTAKQAELIEQLDDKEAVSLLENIPSDEAADLLLKLPKVKTRRLMKLMETKTSKKLSKLLGFSKNSAGGLMSSEYLALPQSALVKDAIQKMKENPSLPSNIYYFFVVDEQNHFIGSTALRNFMNADINTPLEQACTLNKIFVRTDDSVEKVALLLEKYKFSVMPVLNEEDILQGVITIDDVLEELISLAWSKYKEKL